MKIVIVGTGYVGLVSGACFSDIGHDVLCLDKDKNKIAKLKKGIIPIYEPGLERIVKFNLKEKRLNFTTSWKEVFNFTNIIFIAVDTPQKSNGSADLSSIKEVCKEISKHLLPNSILIQKSTVPVGTSDVVKNLIIKNLPKSKKNINFSMVSNPEFLKEGSAVNDFMKPDRIIIGLENDDLIDTFKSLYLPLDRKFNKIHFMNIKSSELTKYAANAMLATKISFINELANIADLLRVDIEDIRKGMGADKRIGYEFLYPGCGYGGSCFPKDVNALIHTAKSKSYHPYLLSAVEKINNKQKLIICRKIMKHFKNNIRKLKFAIWGLSFKPQTNDTRFAPSIEIVNFLLSKGAFVRAYDPISSIKDAVNSNIKNYREVKTSKEAINNADALIICTEWKEFWSVDPMSFIEKMNKPVIFDGRNIYSPNSMMRNDISYYAIGRGSQ